MTNKANAVLFNENGRIIINNGQETIIMVLELLQITIYALIPYQINR